jgi:endoglucanase
MKSRLLSILFASAGLVLSILACGRTNPSAPLPTAPPQSSYPDYMPDNPFVHQEGKLVIGLDGQPLKLRGVNLGGWLLWEGWEYGKGLLVSQTVMMDRLTTLVGSDQADLFEQQVFANYITEADIREIASLGFNSVRIPINAKILEDDSQPYIYKDSGWQILDQVLGWCEKYHVYAILDLHAVPGGQSRLTPSDPGTKSQLIWNSPDNQARTVAMWNAIASRYHDRKIVAGYDLINEPLPPNGAILNDLERRITAAIRSVDPDHMLIIEGGAFSSDFSMFPAPISGNQAYGFHMYTWFGDNRSQKFDEMRALTDAQRVPLWAGEFGENTYAMIDSTVAMYENPDNEVSGGWCFWTWKKVPGKHPALLAITAPRSWMAVIDWIGDPNHTPQPSVSQAQEGMNAFLQAIRNENDSLDPQMQSALTQWQK